ncbi:MAG: hypothetical protein Q7S16_00305 [bacterium]|nr:hypothetical protein [bacterium]
MTARQQKIWRKNFSIQRVDYQMPYVVMEEFYHMQKRFPGRVYITEAIWLTKQGEKIATYFRKDELRALTDATLRKIIEDPDAADVLHKKTIQYNQEYFSLSQQFEKMQWQKMSARELVSWYERIVALQRISHSISLSTTWFLDSDGEDFSKYLFGYLEKKIRDLKRKDSAASVFSVLTTPLRDSLARVEEKDLLRLCLKIQQSGKAFSIMRAKEFTGNETQCAMLPPAIRSAFVAHYKKWRWVPYTYNGPTYGIDYYAEVVSGLLRQKVQAQKLLQKYGDAHAINRKAQSVLVKNLHIDSHWWNLFRIAQDIVYIKGFRKDCLYYGSYARDLLLEEVARRLHITRMQAKVVGVIEHA